MTTRSQFSRRGFLSTSVGLGIGTAAVVSGNAFTSADDKATPNLPPSHPARWLADKFVQWQNPYGRLDPGRCPVADGGHRVISHSFIWTWAHTVQSSARMRPTKRSQLRHQRVIRSCSRDRSLVMRPRLMVSPTKPKYCLAI